MPTVGSSQAQQDAKAQQRYDKWDLLLMGLLFLGGMGTGAAIDEGVHYAANKGGRRA